MRTQSSLFMERASYEHAILWCGNFALTSDPNATRVTYHFADHVFSCMAVSTLFQGLHIHLTSTDRPFGDVIWPDIGGHRGRRFTKPLRRGEKIHYYILYTMYTKYISNIHIYIVADASTRRSHFLRAVQQTLR